MSGALLADYSGPFVPGLGLERFTRSTLAVLGREYLLAGHLRDRIGIPLLISRHGPEPYAEVAIAEWMGASPVYAPRLQRRLAFAGQGVGTIFKGLQMDIGAAKPFLDMRFSLDSDEAGEFWLDQCGALLDVAVLGEDAVRLMCHDIEDPTFDATAVATNPRARMRPVHRPPETVVGARPACRWRVEIDPAAEPVELPELARQVGRSVLAGVGVDDPGADAEPGGWTDYSGPFAPDFALEDLAHRALVLSAQEFCVQNHLLLRAFLLTVADRWGGAEADTLASEHWVGIAALAARRVAGALAIPREGAVSVAKVFQLHPHFLPRTYIDLRVRLVDDATLSVSIQEGSAVWDETDRASWVAQLDHTVHPALSAIAREIDPRARCRAVAPEAGARLTWQIDVDPERSPAPAPPEVELIQAATMGADFVMLARGARLDGTPVGLR